MSDALTEKLTSLGVSSEAIDRALFDSAPFVDEGAPTVFGLTVLEMDAEHALALASDASLRRSKNEPDKPVCRCYVCINVYDDDHLGASEGRQ